MDMIQTHWTPTVNQDGVDVTARDVQLERLNYYKSEISAKRDEFERALSAKCVRDDEVYNKLPYHAPVDGPVYQVGMSVYALVAGINGVHPAHIGVIQ